MKKNLLVLTLFLLISGAAMAQYDYAIGLRSGGTSGLTLKKNYGATAIEGLIGFWHDGFSVTALWEKNQMAFNEPGLNWVYGVGGHIAVYGNDFDGRGSGWYDHPHDYDDGDLGLGIDGIVGLEYKIPNAPIAFGIDLKPYLEIVTEGGVLFSIDPGIGVKVAF
ncbi:hypothetical protein [Sunxiuqinia elliptica]|uniref:Outer membrane protein beta-barrel domain-containing protein n=1 Tax=Sunxiuqinia elliptica TaxID=655355 RepID=A0A4R6H4Z9_9BACT|nr:hypothetical protein [Sunxiuqinia elliptica]TDO03210.1 hypothetical protein DET52_103151 [Sunxiuqinia elliptica]TDO59407.1 hypothetical protein DET65_2694 [Sunxiuqinia elliptica]